MPSSIGPDTAEDDAGDQSVSGVAPDTIDGSSDSNTIDLTGYTGTAGEDSTSNQPALMAGQLSPDSAGDSAGDGASSGPTAPASPTESIELDVCLLAGPPLCSVYPPGSTLDSSSDCFVHLNIAATDSIDGTVVDLTSYSVSMAVVVEEPNELDWVEAEWISRTASPVGSYARVPLGPTVGRVLSQDYYRVYARINVDPQKLVTRGSDMLVVL